MLVRNLQEYSLVELEDILSREKGDVIFRDTESKLILAKWLRELLRCRNAIANAQVQLHTAKIYQMEQKHDSSGSAETTSTDNTHNS